MLSTPSSSPWRIPDSSWLTPTDRPDRHCAVHREPDVVDHLPGVELVDEHLLAAARPTAASASAGNGHSVTGRNEPTA